MTAQYSELDRNYMQLNAQHTKLKSEHGELEVKHAAVSRELNAAVKANGKLQTKFRSVEAMAKKAIVFQGQLNSLNGQYEKLKVEHEHALLRLQEAEDSLKSLKRKSSSRLLRQSSSKFVGMLRK